jgi:hypothetical protein
MVSVLKANIKGTTSDDVKLDDNLKLSLTYMNSVLASLDAGKVAVIIGSSDHDLPWTILVIMIMQQIERARNGEKNLFIVLRMSWYRKKSGLFLIPLLEEAMDFGVTVSLEGAFNAFKNEERAKHEGIVVIFEALSGKPNFRLSLHSSHCKAAETNYASSGAGGNYTKTKWESGAGNAVIAFFSKDRMESSLLGRLFTGTVEELNDLLKTEFNTESLEFSNEDILFKTRVNISYEEYFIRRISQT